MGDAHFPLAMSYLGAFSSDTTITLDAIITLKTNQQLSHTIQTHQKNKMVIFVVELGAGCSL